MEVSRAQVVKMELERNISALLHDYEKETGLQPTSISFVRREKYKDDTLIVEDNTYAVEVKVEI